MEADVFFCIRLPKFCFPLSLLSSSVLFDTAESLNYPIYFVVNTRIQCVIKWVYFIQKNKYCSVFLVQEKQERHLDQLKRKVNTPEGVPRLFHLIKVEDERLKVGFYELMRNTVVARDLDQVNFIFSLSILWRILLSTFDLFL